MLGKLIINDIFKQRRTMLISIVILIPLFTSLLLMGDFAIRYKNYLYPLAVKKGFTSWDILLKEQKIVYFKEFLPLFGAMVISSMFDTEYKNNGWILELTTPISRRKIIISKYITSLIFMVIMLVVNIISLIIIGKVNNFPENIEVMYFVKMFFIQIIPLAAVMPIHLYIAIRSKNTIKSVGIAGLICIVSSNLFYNESNISKFNPYSFASFSDGLTNVNYKFIIISSIILAIVGLIYTLNYFNKKECY